MIIQLPATATLSTAEDLHRGIMEVLQQSETVEVDCSDVVEADLSLVQLLVAARRTAAASGKSLRLAAPAAGVVRDMLVRGGFVESCGGELEEFWTGK
jgi:ABC-type transporter Mla MlaB component